MTERLRYFPTKTLILVLLGISAIINFRLYNELKSEQEKRYWISTSEYNQIVDEIKRLENNPLGVK